MYVQFHVLCVLCSLAVEIRSFVRFILLEFQYTLSYIYLYTCTHYTIFFLLSTLLCSALHTIHSYHTAENIHFFLLYTILFFLLSVRRPTDNNDGNEQTDDETSGVERENYCMKAKAKGSRENENVHNAYSLYTVC